MTGNGTVNFENINNAVEVVLGMTKNFTPEEVVMFQTLLQNRLKDRPQEQELLLS